MFTPEQALEAIRARIQGEFDNEQLLKIEQLGTLENDILYIIESVKPGQ